jgi:hypothetical protein
MPPDLPTAEVIADRRAAMAAHPQFVAAMRRSAANKTDLFFRQPQIHRFAIDKGSSLLNVFVTCLHYSDEGLTLAALKSLCADSKLCSPGRVVAFVAAMRKRGDIRPADPASRNRTRKLVLGPDFLAFQQERLRAEISATSLLSPLGDEGLKAFADERFFASYMRVVLGLVFAYRTTLANTPVVEFFYERHGGMLLLHDVIGASENTLESLPVAISVSAMSKRFRISRAHILKLLRDAHSEGLVTWHAGRRELTLSPDFVLSLKRYFGSIFTSTIYCLSMTLPQLKECEAVAAD